MPADVVMGTSAPAEPPVGISVDAAAIAAQGGVDTSAMGARIRGHDWGTTPLGPMEHWPPHLRATVDLMLAHGFPMIVLWGRDLIQLYNDGYAEVLADKHPAGLGQPTATCWPEVWHINGPIYNRVWQGETITYEDKLYPLARRGPLEDAWFTITYSPIRDASGRIDGVLVTMFETTAAHLARREQERAEAELREAGLRARTLVEGMSQAVWETDPDGMVVADSPSWRSYTGQRLDQWRGTGWLQAVHPEDREHVRECWFRGIRERRDIDEEFRLWHAGSNSHRWTNVRATPMTAPDGTVSKWVGMNIDINDRRCAEAAQRESEERLALAIKLLPVGFGILNREGEVVMANDRMRGYLPTGRAPSRDKETMQRWRTWADDGTPIAPTDFPGARALRGETVVPGMEFLYTTDDGDECWTRVAAAPLLDDEGQVTAVFSIIVDIDALKRTAETLRANEERFRQFAAASSDALWIRNADTFSAEYLSAAFDDMHGIGADAALGALRNWAAMVVPDDRNQVLEHLRQIAAGKRHVQEYRIQRRDNGGFRWIRDTAFPLYDAQGRVSRIAGIATDVTQTRRSMEHQSVLLAELQHRVRNIMAMTHSITARTKRTARDVDDYAKLLSGRLMSLARTQALLTRAANVGVSMRTLIHEELAAQALDCTQFELDGPDIVVPPKAAEVLSLAVHELSTNALKHGALGCPEGVIKVQWALQPGEPDPMLTLAWNESHPARPSWAPPKRRGFGSALVEDRVPYELNGTGRITYRPDGVDAWIAFPMRARDSILETDAPQHPGVAGGSIDLSGDVRLDGQRVLVLDDDFYLAQDTAGALRSAGATVVGPFSDSAEAVAAASAAGLTAAVVDINLGAGPDYRAMDALRSRGTPFILLTGYDQAAVAPEHADAPRLQKPTTPRQVVLALARLVGG